MVGWNDKDDVMMRGNGIDASAEACSSSPPEDSSQENPREY